MIHTKKVFLLAIAACLLANNVQAQFPTPEPTTPDSVDSGSTTTTVVVGSPQSTTVTVNYADLNLETKSGARTMLKRLKKAAKHACGHSPIKSVAYGLFFGGINGAIQSCRMQAIDDALSHMDEALMKRILGE